MAVHKPEDTRRSEILIAARRLWVQRGYESTSMNEVAEAAGLSKGGLYFHFDSKHDLFMACLDFHFESILAVVAPLIPNLAAGAAGLIELAEGYSKYLLSEPEIARFYLVMNEVSLRDEPCRNALLHHHHRPVLIAIQFALEGRSVPPVEMRSEHWGRRKPSIEARLIKAMLDGMTETAVLGDPIEWQDLVAPMSKMLYALENNQPAYDRCCIHK